MLDRIRIILVNTSHPGNIGSAARAMKTMGLHQLFLVDPLSFPHPKAKEMATGAADLSDKAIIAPTIEEAIQDCTLAIGTSTRSRTIPWPLVAPRTMAEKIAKEPEQSRIAILFGREQSGLSNEELQQCHLHLQIPTDPSYSSLNLAAAVQVIAYELHLASLSLAHYPESWDYRPATVSELEHFFKHLQTVLIEIEFLKPEAPRQLMTRLRRLFLRARPDAMEINMLRGMLTAVQEGRDARLKG